MEPLLTLPAASRTCIRIVLLPERVTPVQVTVVPETKEVILVQLVPLSVDPQSCSADADPLAAASAVERVPVIVWLAVLVTPSLLLDPVSADSAIALTVFVGTVASTMIAPAF